MKKCTQCEFTTLDDTLEYCYRCGGKLQLVLIAPATANDTVKSTTHYVCSNCGIVTDSPDSECECGGAYIPVVDENIIITPPILKEKEGKIKRCTNCDYTTNNLSYSRCPKCSYPLFEVNGKSNNEQQDYDNYEMVVVTPLAKK